MLRYAVFITLFIACYSDCDCSSDGYCNVAGGGIATSSSSRFGGFAELAIDGNTDGVFSNKSCSYTRAAEENWWNLELDHALYGLTLPISHVVVHNRLDCCEERINGLKVRRCLIYQWLGYISLF